MQVRTMLRLFLYVSVLALALSVPTSTAAPPTPTVNVDVVNTPLPVQGTVNVGNFPTRAQNVNVTRRFGQSGPPQNGGGGAATQVEQTASQILALKCEIPVIVTVIVTVFRCDDLSGNEFSVPPTKALVLTDLQW